MLREGRCPEWASHLARGPYLEEQVVAVEGDEGEIVSPLCRGLEPPTFACRSKSVGVHEDARETGLLPESRQCARIGEARSEGHALREARRPVAAVAVQERAPVKDRAVHRLGVQRGRDAGGKLEDRAFAIA